MSGAFGPTQTLFRLSVATIHKTENKLLYAESKYFIYSFLFRLLFFWFNVSRLGVKKRMPRKIFYKSIEKIQKLNF